MAITNDYKKDFASLALNDSLKKELVADEAKTRKFKYEMKFLSYVKDKGWKIESLNLFQRIFRHILCCSFKSIRLNNIYKALNGVGDPKEVSKEDKIKFIRKNILENKTQNNNESSSIVISTTSSTSKNSSTNKKISTLHPQIKKNNLADKTSTISVHNNINQKTMKIMSRLLVGRVQKEGYLIKKFHKMTMKVKVNQMKNISLQ